MFSLRYKFIFIVLLLLALALSGAFAIARYVLQQQSITTLQTRLHQAARQHHSLLLHQRTQLQQLSNALQRNMQLGHAVQQQNATQLLDQYPLPELWVLEDNQQNLLAHSEAMSVYLPDFQAHQQDIINNEKQPQSQWLYWPQASVFVVTVPIHADTTYVGRLLLLHTIDSQDLQHLKHRSGFEIALLNNEKLVLHSAWDDDHHKQQLTVALSKTWHQQLSTLNAQFSSEQRTVQHVHLGEQHWLYLGVPAFSLFTHSMSAPTYVFIQSVQVQTALFQILGEALIWLGVLMLGISLLLLWPVFHSLQQAFQRLHTTAEQIEKKNYAHQTDIVTRDEFSHLDTSFNQAMQTLTRRERLHTAMEMLVSRELAEAILEKNLQPEGEIHSATVLYSGIRDFSHLVSHTKEVKLLEYLNNYFTRMDFCVTTYDGFIDKYFGDHLLALFGLNTQQSNVGAAIRAAREMQEALLLFNLELGENQGYAWKFGIGIHSGELVAGNIGAENRCHYSVIGNPIRLAAELEKLTKTYGVSILISQFAYQQLRQETETHYLLAACRELDVIQLDGHSESLKIYQILSYQEADNPHIQHYLQRFQEARQALQERKFAQALEAFQSLHEDWPEDRPTRLLLQRCRRYLQDNTRYSLENPQGAFVLTAVA